MLLRRIGHPRQATDRWRDAWIEQSQRTQARAETVRQHGHAVSAREAFLRAYPYYRVALLFMRLRTIPALDRSAASTDLPPHGGDTPRPAL